MTPYFHLLFLTLFSGQDITVLLVDVVDSVSEIADDTRSVTVRPLVLEVSFNGRGLFHHPNCGRDDPRISSVEQFLGRELFEERFIETQGGNPRLQS